MLQETSNDKYKRYTMEHKFIFPITFGMMVLHVHVHVHTIYKLRLHRDCGERTMPTSLVMYKIK